MWSVKERARTLRNRVSALREENGWSEWILVCTWANQFFSRLNSFVAPLKRFCSVDWKTCSYPNKNRSNYFLLPVRRGSPRFAEDSRRKTGNRRSFGSTNEAFRLLGEDADLLPLFENSSNDSKRAGPARIRTSSNQLTKYVRVARESSFARAQPARHIINKEHPYQATTRRAVHVAVRRHPGDIPRISSRRPFRISFRGGLRSLDRVVAIFPR